MLAIDYRKSGAVEDEEAGRSLFEGERSSPSGPSPLSDGG